MYFFSRETALRETGLENSRLLLLYTTQNYIETKINKETMLIGSFYRQPSATVDYWDLIRQSFWNVNNTGLKFIAFGDFNSDFSSSSKHLVDILHMFQLHQLTNSGTRIVVHVLILS